jgi:hypothetical protein
MSSNLKGLVRRSTGYRKSSYEWAVVSQYHRAAGCEASEGQKNAAILGHRDEPRRRRAAVDALEWTQDLAVAMTNAWAISQGLR